jgi:hypothetical protein
MKKVIFLFLMTMFVSGCASVKSDYGSLSSVQYAPKTEQEEVSLLISSPNRPYKEIGIIQVQGKIKTSIEKLNQEMLKKARSVGADSVMNIQYSGGNVSAGMVGGVIIAVGSKKTAQGTAIIFTDK